MVSISKTKIAWLSLIFLSFVQDDLQKKLEFGKYIISSTSLSFKEITINKNNSFYRHISGCNGPTDDKGKWIRSGDTLITIAAVRSELFYASKKKQYKPLDQASLNTTNKYLIKKDSLFYLSIDPDNNSLAISDTLTRNRKK